MTLRRYAPLAKSKGTVIPPAPALDVAWTAAEAALPEGWFIQRVMRGGGLAVWVVDARGPVIIDAGAIRSEGEQGRGDTIPSALLDLAARLTGATEGAPDAD